MPECLNSNPIELLFVQDKVYLMPRVIMQLIFYIPELVKTPIKRATTAAFIGVLIEKVSMDMGYEAVLADVSYSIKVFENVGLKCKFKGYNDKIHTFVLKFMSVLAHSAEHGLTDSEEYLITNSIEKVKKDYNNYNVEID